MEVQEPNIKIVKNRPKKNILRQPSNTKVVSVEKSAVLLYTEAIDDITSRLKSRELKNKGNLFYKPPKFQKNEKRPLYISLSSKKRHKKSSFNAIKSYSIHNNSSLLKKMAKNEGSVYTKFLINHNSNHSSCTRPRSKRKGVNSNLNRPLARRQSIRTPIQSGYKKIREPSSRREREAILLVNNKPSFRNNREALKLIFG